MSGGWGGVENEMGEVGRDHSKQVFLSCSKDLRVCTQPLMDVKQGVT